MAYINTKTMEYPVYVGDIKQRFPNISFPADFIPPEDYALVQEVPIPKFDKDLYRVSEGTPTLVEGIWKQTWEILPLSEEEISRNLDTKRSLLNVTPLQAKIALMQAGYYDEIEALMTNHSTDPIIKLAWTEAQVFERTSPAVISIATTIGLSDTDLDSLFEAAKLIKI